MLRAPLIAFLFVALGQSTGLSGPGARHGHDLAYDEQRSSTLLFGGFGEDGVALSDTWLWDGAGWREENVDGPTPRRWPAMAYDAKRGVVLLFGGRDGIGANGRSLNDTWIWNGRSWRVVEGDGPTGRDHHRMVYDRHRDRIILFGGWDGTKLLGDTWEWDGRSWRRIPVEGPSPRAAYGLAYDEARQEVVLFGGNALGPHLGDTWTWNGSRWRRHDATGPSPRAFQGMTYDPGKHRVLLFSGRGEDRVASPETWMWNGARWSKTGSTGPIQEGIYALTYDRSRKAALFHGGGDFRDSKWLLRNATWVFHGNKWRVAPPPSKSQAPS